MGILSVSSKTKRLYWHSFTVSSITFLIFSLYSFILSEWMKSLVDVNCLKYLLLTPFSYKLSATSWATWFLPFDYGEFIFSDSLILKVKRLFKMDVPTPVDPWKLKTRAFLGFSISKWAFSADNSVFLTRGWPNNWLFIFCSRLSKLVRTYGAWQHSYRLHFTRLKTCLIYVGTLKS